MAGLELACELALGRFRCAPAATLPLNGISALFGPSGSGKTLTLRMIAGLEPGATGRVALDGTVWMDTAKGRQVPTHQRGAAMVFQDARLFGHLNVGDNLGFAERRGFGHGPEIKRGDVVDALDLGGLLERPVDGLSGGERQRVAIGRAVLARPRLLLMDEPLSALDLPRRAEILNYIEALPAQFGIPIIYVTHAIDEVARLADALALMSSGRIVACGPVQETLARLDLPPLTGRFEAGAVLEGKVSGQDEAYALTTIDIGGAELILPALDLPVGEVVRLRVRARDVSIALRPPRDVSIRNVLGATVAEVMPESDTAFAEVRLSIGDQDLRARVTRLSADELKLMPGLDVYALVKSVTLDRRMLTRPSPSDAPPDRSR